MKKKQNHVTWIQIALYIDCIETEDIYVDIVAKDAETRFGTSIYELDRSLWKRKTKKSNWINKWRIRCRNIGRVCCIGTEKI